MMRKVFSTFPIRGGAFQISSWRSNHISANQLIVEQYGNPSEVVTMENIIMNDELDPGKVLVRFLAAPINPADINTIQGIYAIKPNCPFIPGNEGVMEVVKTHSSNSNLIKGDKVIPAQNAMGTWRTHGTFKESELMKIPSDIDNITAATISVNPCTAFRMLHDYVQLKEKDVVIQNCANSAVGLAVIQIAHSMGVQTINIIRDRPDLEELRRYMKNLGATVVVTDSEVKKSEEVSALPKPILGLNGVSGRATLELIKRLEKAGTVVTYGGMSKQPLMVPVGSLIFTDLTFRGFWMTRWNKLHSESDKSQMLTKLFELYKKGQLKAPPCTEVPFKDYQKGLHFAMPMDGKVSSKQVLVF